MWIKRALIARPPILLRLKLAGKKESQGKKGGVRGEPQEANQLLGVKIKRTNILKAKMKTSYRENRTLDKEGKKVIIFKNMVFLELKSKWLQFLKKN